MYSSIIITAQRLSGLRCVFSNLEENADTMQEEFSSFLISLMSSWNTQQDQEELGIIQQ